MIIAFIAGCITVAGLWVIAMVIASHVISVMEARSKGQ